MGFHWSAELYYKNNNKFYVIAAVSFCAFRPSEISFGDDAVLDYTLMQGDLVEFLVAVDRRDKLQHAINIRIIRESFAANNELREKVINLMQAHEATHTRART